MAIQTQRRSDGKLFIDGRFRESSGGAASAVAEKATGRELGRQAIGSLRELDEAIAGAKAAQPGWAAQGYDERAGLLRRVAHQLEDRADEYVDLIVRETGSIPGKAQYEVAAAGNELYEAAGLASRATGEILPSHNTGKLSMIQRVPVGVVGVITPWNFPLILGMRAVAPAIALGNTVILKPATLTPITGGQLIAELFEAAGALPGLLQVVTGAGGELGDAMASHPGISMIHFTGSSEVGRRIAESAGRNLKKVSLELGGNNAFVVLDDADVETASMLGAWSAFHYQGQTCITASRHIVMRGVADEYREALARRARAIVVGDPSKAGIGLGPIIDEHQRDRAHGFVTASVRQGARIVEGGTFDGLFYRPTVLDDVTPQMPAFTEEIFGPIAPITVVDTEEEALALTNQTDYGLVNYVITADIASGLAFAEKVNSGMVHVNDATPLDEAHVPFGGMGASGLGGRSGGEANLEEFTERRWISIQRTPVQYPY
jgi:benzaldehyde dehydrogenase (NAD)